MPTHDSDRIAPEPSVTLFAPWTRLAAVGLFVWHTTACLVVLLLPTQYRTGKPVWELPAEAMVQAAWGGLGYLLAALLREIWRASSRRDRLMLDALAVAVAFAVIATVRWVLPTFPHSFGLLALAAAVSLLLLTLQTLAERRIAVVLIPLALVAGATIFRGYRIAQIEDFSIDTQFYSLRVRVHRTPELARSVEVEGGGLTRIGGELLLVTGAGQFFHVRAEAGGTFDIRALPVASPANAADFAAAASAGVLTRWFRVTDIAAAQDGDTLVVSVAHHFWRAVDKCFVLRVSVASVSADLSHWSPWKTLFDAQPCLPIRSGQRGLPFSGSEAGGRLQHTPEGLLLSVGDHRFDGFNADRLLAQDPTSHYGKTVLLQTDGSAEIFTSGHRNPQGLTLDPQGVLWETEHGPQGGDELNLLVKGANYGWPWRTLGTEYAMRTWPPLRPSSPAMREPHYAFVPSNGISNLIAPSWVRFPEWKGDLLIGTLKNRELLRVHLDGTRPQYVEEIRIGFELRDLEEAPDGSLVAWTDQGALLSIDADQTDVAGGEVVVACAGCHSLNQGQRGALGPNLFAVVDRKIGTAEGFNYSAALKRVGGRWTTERLDAFLYDPAAFAPGTSMAVPGISDPKERAAVIEYLRTSEFRR